MSFPVAVRGMFFGQERILGELDIYAQRIIKGADMNLLFVAPSGHGKTRLSHLFLEYVDPGFTSTLRYIPRKSDLTIRRNTRFHMIDEAHKLKNPETIYDALDSEKYTIVIATNEYDALKEPLANRCIPIIFESYSDKDLAQILEYILVKKGFPLPKEWYFAVVPYCRNSPRTAVLTAKRLAFAFGELGVPLSVEELHSFMRDTLGSGPGGYTDHDLSYIRTLQLCGGTAGIRTIKGMLNIPLKVIVEDIEPFLITKGRIQITSKGRTLIE
jgi:Holliday junction resolvasome RuvABC ATP-dependent DNA helicase subunit